MKADISEGLYAIQNRVPTDELDAIYYAWRNMYSHAGYVIGEFSMSNPKKYVVSKIVQHSHVDDEYPRITVLRLNIELYLSSVARVVMHEFVYSTANGDPIEWKCGHCGLPNIIQATFCGEEHKSAAGCGAPRDFLRNGEKFNEYLVPTKEWR